MRRPVVAGNWKMNPATVDEAIALARAAERAAASSPQVDVVVCPPTIWLPAVAKAVRAPLALGAQTMHDQDRGAFTGETSPLMLAGLATFVILGHSERRQHYGEFDEAVGLKVASAVAHGLRPIAAVGELAVDRRSGQTAAVIDRQVRAAIDGLERIAGCGLVIAYEPVWAIGTGQAASPADAQDAAEQIRSILAEADPEGAADVPIQYGGSVTADNAAGFFAQPDIDGALVGGASLQTDAFAAIVRAAEDAVPAR
ncbi:MAG TPA: triose-phosphate isomerase [Candidatus Limnocylindria bacterium]|nr:triose-phosphate isomerase [Candidatus Limnocylindria bacterium]